MRSPFDFRGRKVLVTGGARGIGLSLTRHLGARGSSVLAVGRDEDALERLKKEASHVAGTLVVDLGNEGSPSALADWVAAEHPDTSALINNAAIMVHTDLVQDPMGHMDEIAAEIAVNPRAPLQLLVAMIPVLRRQTNAATVNVTSGLAIAPKRDAAVYCATKAGLRSFTRSLRDQCRRAGYPIQVTEVVMSLVDTTLSRQTRLRKYPADHAAEDLLRGVERGLDRKGKDPSCGSPAFPRACQPHHARPLRSGRTSRYCRT